VVRGIERRKERNLNLKLTLKYCLHASLLKACIKTSRGTFTLESRWMYAEASFTPTKYLLYSFPLDAFNRANLIFFIFMTCETWTGPVGIK
jgi:hypothetical protein